MRTQTMELNGVPVTLPDELASTTALAHHIGRVMVDCKNPKDLESLVWDLKNKIESKYEQFKKFFPDPIERAKAYHRAIDVTMKKEKEKHDAANPDLKVSCRVGCGACCRMLAVPTDEEAELLAEQVISGKAPVDLKKLEEMAIHEADPDLWFKLSAQRKVACPFLGDKNECRVYEDRPVACRIHYSVSPAALCEPGPKGEVTQIQNLFLYETQILASSMIQGDKENHSLQRKLYRVLKRRGYLSKR